MKLKPSMPYFGLVTLFLVGSVLFTPIALIGVYLGVAWLDGIYPDKNGNFRNFVSENILYFAIQAGIFIAVTPVIVLTWVKRISERVWPKVDFSSTDFVFTLSLTFSEVIIVSGLIFNLVICSIAARELKAFKDTKAEKRVRFYHRNQEYKK